MDTSYHIKKIYFLLLKCGYRVYDVKPQLTGKNIVLFEDGYGINVAGISFIERIEKVK